MAGKAAAILLAGGRGARAGRPKQFARAGGRSLLLHAVEPFLACREIGLVVLVTPADQVARVEREVKAQHWDRPVLVTAGDRSRHGSSRRGLAALPDALDTVLIHDAARPFVEPPLIRRVIRAARRHGAAIPALPVTDSMVVVGTKDRVREYQPRERLRAVQTPQGFRRDVVDRAFARARRRDFPDDASVVRAAGSPVVVVQGDPGNQKITSARDLTAALRRLGG